MYLDQCLKYESIKYTELRMPGSNHRDEGSAIIQALQQSPWLFQVNLSLALQPQLANFQVA